MWWRTCPDAASRSRGRHGRMPPARPCPRGRQGRWRPGRQAPLWPVDGTAVPDLDHHLDRRAPRARRPGPGTRAGRAPLQDRLSGRPAVRRGGFRGVAATRPSSIRTPPHIAASANASRSWPSARRARSPPRKPERAAIRPSTAAFGLLPHTRDPFSRPASPTPAGDAAPS